MTRSRWVFVLIALLLVFAAAANAQTEEFVIRSPSSSLSPDGSSIIVQFDVTNNGDQNATTVARLFDSRGLQITSEPLQLPPGGTSVAMSVPVDRFDPGTRQGIYITVGLDALPGNLRSSNAASISIGIPAAPVAATPQQGGQGGALPFNLPFDLDLRDPTQLVLIVAIGALILLLLWVISVVIRSATARPEPFGAWQAAYPSPPHIDPNTTVGRRYLWQQHAQSDNLPLPCQPGSIIALKHVTGQDGDKFESWRVTGIRTGRYDQYGRIGRTNHTASPRLVKRLDRAARRRRLAAKPAARAAKPIARALVKDIIKSSDKRSAILPIALEIRFKGKSIKAETTFELLRCEGNGWLLMDSWSAPPTQSTSGGAVEQFSYTFYGQRPNEPKRDFEKRLEQALTQVLTGLVFKPERPKLEDTSEHTPVEPPEAPPTIRQAPVTEVSPPAPPVMEKEDESVE